MARAVRVRVSPPAPGQHQMADGTVTRPARQRAGGDRGESDAGRAGCGRGAEARVQGHRSRPARSRAGCKTRLEQLARTVRLPGLPPGQGAAAAAEEAVWPLDPGRGAGGGGRRGLQEAPSATTSCARRCGRRSRSPRSTRARTSSSSSSWRCCRRCRRSSSRGISLTRLVAETPPEKVEQAIENFATLAPEVRGARPSRVRPPTATRS